MRVWNAAARGQRSHQDKKGMSWMRNNENRRSNCLLELDVCKDPFFRALQNRLFPWSAVGWFLRAMIGAANMSCWRGPVVNMIHYQIVERKWLDGRHAIDGLRF